MKKDTKNVAREKEERRKAGIRDGIFNNHNFVNDAFVIREKENK